MSPLTSVREKVKYQKKMVRCDLDKLIDRCAILDGLIEGSRPEVTEFLKTFARAVENLKRGWQEAAKTL